MIRGPRVLVCGTGSIGRRHITNLLYLGAEVAVWRARLNILEEVAQEFGVRTFRDLAEGIAESEAVVVATATDQHAPIAKQALEAGRNLFIEKPVSHSWVGIDELSSLAERAVVEVGCQLRAHPNLVALSHMLKQTEHGRPLTYRLSMGHRLDAWRPAQDYRRGYSSDSNRGGGALFDLIHQIDIALWFFGPVTAVQAVLAKRSNLDIRCEDIANLLVSHKSGVVGHIQLDMASPVYRCDAEIMTTKSLFRWSGPEGMLRCNTTEGERVVDQLPPQFERNDLFLSHMTYFLQRLENPTLPPLCAFADGVAALRVALGAREAHAGERAVHFDDIS